MKRAPPGNIYLLCLGVDNNEREWLTLRFPSPPNISFVIPYQPISLSGPA